MSNELVIPSWLMGCAPEDCYVLRVVGGSMESDGIHDGDYVIVHRGHAEPGDMIVALVGDDATLKRYYPNPDLNTVTLASDARNVPEITVPLSDLVIQGVIKGLVRKSERRERR